MPIADVAGDTAGRAALEEVAREMTAAEDEGRVVKRIALNAIEMHHLNRDRLVLEEEDMAALQASLAARGQQTPIEVVRSGAGRYGLISGMRRVVALKALGEAEVLAFIRRPDSAEAAYQAMVEENELRADLSFYERANIAVTAVGSGVYPTPRAAVAGLFAHTTAPRRSKILKFVTVREALGKALRFPTAIPERLGLALAAGIEADRALASRIGDALRKTPPEDATAERRLLERALKAPSKSAAAPEATGAEIAPGVRLSSQKGRAVLSGPGVTPAFLDKLKAWAAKP